MAGPYYVRSTDGNNSDNGSTWALAKATLAGAAAVAVAGDTIYVSQVHAETGAGTVVWAGTKASPNKVICGNDGAQPPTAVAATASQTANTAANIGVSGSAYFYGIIFNSFTGSGGSSIGPGQTADCWQRFEQCQFVIQNTNAASGIFCYPSTTTISTVEWINCSIKFGAVGQKIFTSGGTVFRWTGGSVLSGGSTPTVLFSTYGSATVSILVEDIDFSNFGTGAVFTAPPPAGVKFVMRNCRLPASWAGTLISTAFTTPGRAEMYDCDNAATNYKLWIEDYAGTIRDETTVVRSGGASDGTTSLSWKMTSSANTGYPIIQLASPEIAFWNNTTGASKTLTVQVLSSTTLTDAQAWLEVDYLGTSAAPVGTLITDEVADPLTAAANQTSSAASWNTSGVGTPNAQELAVTFTPQLKGYYLARVMLAKASTTIYVDPLITVT